MIIARDRYLDDTSRYLLTLELRTRTPAAHGLLTDAGREEQQAIGDILVRALDEIAARLAAHLPGRRVVAG
ncbi:MAG TPA: hypothetical protein VNI83_05270 [Vicinamibacterales bacterium]|nr:hypothetical protein [Vicinamibacterales bacterium]